ncbi:hypothetical protein [Catenisphaera adipataccumulans]|uniref:Recombinational DNA repair protein RecR n=1 Tax=Catenisphaera adipataccumulans TaxID=700500 RepID=A0A7W8CWV7_9FIRM|nr:hypothetical protein [Catenisphaera adipataccumulans]MBB5183058.1 recombinational DNA repair protein RecR [Catenisphaera adipataccumulans]
MMNMAPDYLHSTREERLSFIQKMYQCRSNCEMCGICTLFHRKDPLDVFEDYIDGRRDYTEILMEYR